ncbi:germination protein GerKC [Halobacillus andaensis]|uniref:Germination protein GerKC n=1 Tax=Halobacillus andaensis TaxID=1176239 RepID=A0A917B885_HALAA|nr:Ger(x)C family spore germination protein [Halobacillus andaensis]MBP2005151.1 spore germination protein KC [Halobacillus andaensis]GGF29232.1 germination protein GerKC [Halobacillus andaensis]
MLVKKGVFFKIPAIVLCFILLTGCWNSNELDEIGIVVAMGIDKTDDNQYELVAQVINPSEIATDAPTTRPPVSTYSTTGKTLLEAFRKLTHKSPRKMYLSQLRLLVLGKDLAEEGIISSLDLFYREHEFRTGFYVTIAKDTDVDTLLSTLTAYEKIPANKLMNSIEAVETGHGSSKGITIDELISQIHSKGQSPVIAGVFMEGPEEGGTNISNVENIDAPVKLTIDHLGVLKDDRLVGWLDEDASMGYNYILGNIKSSVITHPCQDGTASIEILRTQSSMDAAFAGGEPSISIELDLEGNIGELNCPIDLSKEDSIQNLNKETEKEIKRLMEASIKSAQNDYETDIFGFGSLIHRKNPKYWKTVENDWDTEFKDLHVDIQVKADLRRKGDSTQPIIKEG